MTDGDLLRLLEQLERQEGVRLKPYRDSVGKLTIGCGRNLDDVGISAEEADYLLANDVATARDDLARVFPWFRTLDSVRQAALVNLRFNLGFTKLMTFEKALTAMSRKQYGLASDEFFDSRWAKQVGRRAVELCAQIRTGKWQLT